MTSSGAAAAAQILHTSATVNNAGLLSFENTGNSKSFSISGDSAVRDGMTNFGGVVNLGCWEPDFEAGLLAAFVVGLEGDGVGVVGVGVGVGIGGGVICVELLQIAFPCEVCGRVGVEDDDVEEVTMG